MDIVRLEKQRQILETKLNQNRLSLSLIRAQSTSNNSQRTPALHCYDGPLHYKIHSSQRCNYDDSVNLSFRRSEIYHNVANSSCYDDDTLSYIPDLHPSDMINCWQKRSDLGLTSIHENFKSDYYILNNLNTFTLKSAHQKMLYRCTIVRDRKYSTYSLYLKNEDGKNIFLLIAHKKNSSSSNYLISTDPTDLSKNSNSFIGKLRSNILGTEFIVFNNGRSPLRRSILNSKWPPREELAAVVYDPNVLGLKGPRKMIVIVPGMDHDCHRVPFVPSSNVSDSILECWKSKRMDSLIEMHNKSPRWNELTQNYILDFHTQGAQASAKNFQIVHQNDESYLVLQLCRVDEDVFSMEYRYPLCPLQAFGIALSSLDNKLACS